MSNSDRDIHMSTDSKEDALKKLLNPSVPTDDSKDSDKKKKQTIDWEENDEDSPDDEW